MRVVLDTCILKLATFPGENNTSALIFQLTHTDLIEAWASPAILEENADVLSICQALERQRLLHETAALRRWTLMTCCD